MLNQRQRKFCEYYVISGNITELLARSKGAFIDKSEISVKPVVITGENFLED